MTKILVVYASKHNSTAEIGTVIGEVLQRAVELQVEVRPVEEVKEITPYDVIVLGSAVYMAQWQPAATDFLKQHEQELAQRPVWLFSSGPIGQGDPATLLKGWEFPETLQSIVTRIKPRHIALFHGSLDTTKLNILERTTMKLVHAPTGDSRDWTTIRAWAESIAQALCGEAYKETPAIQ